MIEGVIVFVGVIEGVIVLVGVCVGVFVGVTVGQTAYATNIPFTICTPTRPVMTFVIYQPSATVLQFDNGNQPSYV